ncbi:MAG: (Fe-S)-binding protein [Anaerolineae bacterium]|nr:(Fe-S)-binding protein [Anaerolineae bacterium]MDW8100248.1 (Fe-S)-binding protein [Anaerolineae bacterium]
MSEVPFSLGNYLPGEAPDLAGLEKCTHCGLCLNQCPTYRVLGVEMDSPRGRIYQMKAVAQGRIEITLEFALHINRCLDCRACVTACPAGVPYGSLVEKARGQIERALPRPRWQRWARQLIFAHLFPYPERLRLVAAILRLYQRSGASQIFRWLGRRRLVPQALVHAESQAPTMPRRFFTLEEAPHTPAHGPQRARVALFVGCIMPLAYADTVRATIRVLARNGCAVDVPRDQRCCGALHIHAGERELARRLARQNMAAFANAEVVIVNAAGCGAALKEYPELFEDPVERARAQAFTAKVKDVTEFLAALPLVPPAGRIAARVTYQDACHLAHAQGIRSQPRQLLRGIKGLELIEMRDADRCCGSAGIYNLIHPELSQKVLAEKLEAIRAVQPDFVVSANPGCILQIEAGLRGAGDGIRVIHIVDLLDRAYTDEDRWR